MGRARRLEVAGLARWSAACCRSWCRARDGDRRDQRRGCGSDRHSAPALPVIAAAADKACEVIGAGCLEPHIGCLSYGTTATINTTTRKYVEAMPLIPPYPAAVPGAYSMEIQIFRGYWMVSWFKEQFGHHENSCWRRNGASPRKNLFDELVDAGAARRRWG